MCGELGWGAYIVRSIEVYGVGLGVWGAWL